MWPSTRLSSAATAASALATGSPARAASSSMASSSCATAPACPARTGTPQRSANDFAISDPLLLSGLSPSSLLTGPGPAHKCTSEQGRGQRGEHHISQASLDERPCPEDTVAVWRYAE